MITTDPTLCIAVMDDAGLEQLFSLFAEAEVTIKMPPRTGLLMMRMQDSFATEMNLGEVLVTEARVRFRESEGYAMVTGEEPRRALARALADAALRCPDDSDTRRQVSDLLELETRRQDAETTREAAMIAATRVNFDLMPGA